MSFTANQVALLDANSDRVRTRQFFTIELSNEIFRLVEAEYAVEWGGSTWTPAVNIVATSAVTRSDGYNSPPMEYEVGVLPVGAGQELEAAYNSMVAEVMNSPETWFGKRVQHYLQLMVDYTPVGGLLSLNRGWIRDINVVEDANTAKFQISVESLFSRRNRTPLGKYTDADIKRRSAGDLGGEFIADMDGKYIEGWPT